MSLSILQAGLLTTVQDLGRWGYQQEGIPVSGAMDALALRIANLLVGNAEDSPVLEICISGPQIEFKENYLIAITGADLSPSINGKSIKNGCTTWIKKGSILSFENPVSGRFAYLAIAGGIKLPKVLGSNATYLKAALGGYKGRALQTGDELLIQPSPLPIGSLIKSTGYLQEADAVFIQASWMPSPDLLCTVNNPAIIRIIKGPEWEWFSPESRQALLQQPFFISNQSDRMGFRLEGCRLQMESPQELLSTAVTFGTIQVPANGAPIVLLADRQTTGGYARIGLLATADFSTFVQHAPGKPLYFQQITLQESQQLYLQQERAIRLLQQAIQLKFKRTTS